MTEYFPEGELIKKGENSLFLSSRKKLNEANENNIILEAPCIMCDSNHNLIVDLGIGKGVIPKNEGALGIESGRTRDIALISRVNKPVCFKVHSLGAAQGSHIILSRRAAQEECVVNFVSYLCAGDIIKTRVTHLEQFGAFTDIGCGIPSLIPIDSISVSRISHPSDRFAVGEIVPAVVRSIDENRITLSHKELMGTWEENAACFEVGQTVSGVVRSVESYGIFIELTPNLAGLAELRDGISVGDNVGVYIKSIIPEKMKIKLVIVDKSYSECRKIRPKYFIESGNIEKWTYSTDKANKSIETVFI